MLRRSLLMLSRSDAVKHLVTSLPVSSGIVARFVAGDSVAEAVDVTDRLVADGRRVTLDHLGEDTQDRASAQDAVEAYLTMLGELLARGLTSGAEVSVKLSAVGQSIPGDGERIALDNARRICQAASNAGTTVTLDMEDHTTTDSTLAILRELRQDFPTTGAVVQAYLHRTEQDCRDLSGPGSRIRLCKGAYAEPASVAFQKGSEVDDSYQRCLAVLMQGQGYPMVASHDPAMIEAALRLAGENGRGAGDYEFQMLYGIRDDEQRRLVTDGKHLRVYVPYGEQWYGYFMRRLAERPANLMFFARSLIGR